MISEPGICATYYGFCICSGIKSQYGMYSFVGVLCALCGQRTDNSGFNNARLFVDGSLNVIRKDVESFRRDDHLLLAAAYEQAALRIFLADVSGVKPPFCVDCSSGSQFPAPGS